MTPSRELEALIAEKVMGCAVMPYEKLKGATLPEYAGTIWMFSGGTCIGARVRGEEPHRMRFVWPP